MFLIQAIHNIQHITNTLLVGNVFQENIKTGIHTRNKDNKYQNL